MTSGDGPVRARRVMVGLAVTAAMAWLLVAGLQVLVRPGSIEPPLGGPAAPDLSDGCPMATSVASADVVDVGASELVECPALFDGRRVRYRGEVVRAVLVRGPRAWVQLNDDPYADIGPLPEHRTAVGGNSGIPVSISAADAAQLRHVGNHRTRGDVVTVTGIFHRADPADGGGPAIQADALTLERPGQPLQHPVNGGRVVVAAGAGLAAVALALRNRAAGHRRRRPGEIP
jgi:hypothetical protein